MDIAPGNDLPVESRVRFTALASGSSGNAYLLEVPGVKLLFDAGLNANTMRLHLANRGVGPEQLAAIFVSHEHIDHLRAVGTLARRYRMPVVASPGTLRAGRAQFGLLPEAIEQQTGSEVLIDDSEGAHVVAVRTFPVSHDAAETTGFWIQTHGYNIVICTDLGCETSAIREPLHAADLLVLEANHDVQRLWSGPYPPHLKRRVAGAHGHLANSETARLVSEIAQDGRSRSVWLAHLSAVNNTPALALEAVNGPLEQAGCTHIRVGVLRRDRPSHTWHRAPLQVASA